MCIGTQIRGSVINSFTPCQDDHQCTKDDFEAVGELTVTSMYLVETRCIMYSQRVGSSCHKNGTRLISYHKCTSDYRQFCHVGNKANECKLGVFPDVDFAGDLTDSKSTSGGLLCIFVDHTIVPISWACKELTAVPHSSTEAEVIPSHAGLKMEGLFELTL